VVYRMVIELSTDDAEQLAALATRSGYDDSPAYVRALIRATIDTLNDELPLADGAALLDDDDVEAFRQSWLKRREGMTDEEFWQSVEEDIVTVYARASQSRISPQIVRQIIAVIEGMGK